MALPHIIGAESPEAVVVICLRNISTSLLGVGTVAANAVVYSQIIPK